MSDHRPCAWCGRRLDQPAGAGRRRRYCGQACRQRAYEQRATLRRTGLPTDAVVLTAAEVGQLHDRLFQLRCAAEDVLTALDDGAEPAELRSVAGEVLSAARSLERLRT
jgi:hypothetical protein